MNRHSPLIRRALRSILLGSAFTFAGLPAFAQQAEDGAAITPKPPQQTPAAQAKEEKTLDPVVITATRTARKQVNTPVAGDVIDEMTYQERNYRTAMDALKDVPGVLPQKTSHGQGSPFIRGLTGYYTLLMVDGIRLNHSVFRSGPNQYFAGIDPFSISRYEVVKGPSSVLFGSDAVGGTINAISRGPSTYGQGLQFGGRTYYRVSSGERSHIGHADFSTTYDEHLGFYVGVTGQHFGDLQGGDDTGRQSHTGYDEFDMDFKLSWFINPDVEIVAAHQRTDKNNVPRTHQTRYGESFNGTTVGTARRVKTDNDRDLTYLQIHAHNLDSTFADSLNASVSFHQFNETQDRIVANGTRDVTGFDLGSVGVWAQLDKQTDLGLITYGFEYYYDMVDSFSSAGRNTVSVGDDSTYGMLGIFIQDQIAVTDRIDMILGGRYSYIALDADTVFLDRTAPPVALEHDWESFVGSARLLYKLVPDRWSLYGGVAQGFRAPNLADLTSSGTNSVSGTLFSRPASHLDPEYFLSYEVGTKVSSKEFDAQFAWFYTDIDDMIVSAPTGRLVDSNGNPGGAFTELVRQNAGEGHITGVEFAAAWRFHAAWRLFGNVAWQEGELENFSTVNGAKITDPVSRLLPLTGEVGLRWDEPQDHKYWVEGVVMMADEQDKLSASDKRDTQRIPPGGTPGYAIFTLRSGWKLDDLTTFFFTIENLLDKDYRIHGSGTNEVGRNFIFAFERKF